MIRSDKTTTYTPPMIPSPGDGANDIIEALKKNTHRIEEKSRVLYAEYIEFLQKKDKSLSEELALLRNQGRQQH